MDKKYKGKSNISIVQDYLSGTRPFVQVGYIPKKIKRSVGEEWQGSDGITWRQEVGYKKRINEQADIIHDAIKEKCKCGQIIKWGSKRDKIFFNRTGLCENCIIDYETKLRIVGIYPYYETYKMVSFEIGYTKDIKEKLTDVIRFFNKNSGDVEMICNSEGFIERWKDTNKNEILEETKKDLKLIHKRIAGLIKIKNEVKKKYKESAKKYNLEVYV